VKPGLYTLNTGQTTIPVAVNLPGFSADASAIPTADIRPVGPEGIRKALGGIPVELNRDLLPPRTVALNDKADAGWNLMFALLLLLGLECFLAMRFGHYRRQGVRLSGSATAITAAMPSAAGNRGAA